MNNTLERNKDSKETIKVIKDSILSQVYESNEYPYFYSVLQFGFYDNQGIRLPISEIRKFWDKNEVDKTCKLIYNMLKEHFGSDIGIWMFKEHHKDLLNEEGDFISKGRFHINIITTNIKDRVVEEPNRKVRRLMLENGRFDVPIENNVYKDLDELKIELFNAVCRKANWINKYQYAVKTQILYEPTDLENVGNYVLKEYDHKSNIDFTDIISWKSSDFYKP